MGCIRGCCTVRLKLVLKNGYTPHQMRQYEVCKSHMGENQTYIVLLQSAHILYAIQALGATSKANKEKSCDLPLYF